MTRQLIKSAVIFSLSIGCICQAAYAQVNPDPAKWHDEGIYYYNKSEPNNLFVQIDQTLPSGTKTGGYGASIAQAYTGGFARSKEQSIIPGAHSKREIHHSSPKFYFYFKADDISPNLFALVHLTQKKNSRIMVTGSSNAYGSTTGLDEGQIVEFTYDKLSTGIYRVYAKAALEQGEYCFIYTGKDTNSPFSGGVYDFGVSAE